MDKSRPIKIENRGNHRPEQINHKAETQPRTQLVIDQNAVYEIDLDCIDRKRK